MKKILLCTALLTSYAPLAHAMNEEILQDMHIPNSAALKAVLLENSKEVSRRSGLTFQHERETWGIGSIYCSVTVPLGEHLRSSEFSIYKNHTERVNSDWDFTKWDGYSAFFKTNEGTLKFHLYEINTKN